ncbi:Sar1 [Monocercomonoides exilis]|uniref:Sar1 n=1 Tax=Monocercomonoides exilis TaxID=2049356 RepID=UPI00355A7EF0|nr:Sar1 [Monocercomonoides exilis]|eukprot:MONOS_9702.1-p1 / transcript=MONOS_9702.1 / gene=MONOS_9702 / organism=Monocercomonoides_exilis_PA203 / gene_product=Sar1 / transcript_product=Sar1 / location=Mono_scaffold00410:46599-47352(+) / protein_length=191 / sequence_SO=supercontig / SO=protein_coding / is_pseudo=false
MFIWKWIKNLLKSWGLINKSGNLLFVGLDGAGKTTLLHCLKFGKIVPQDPTQMPIQEEFTYEKLNIHAYDMGGHVAARPLWGEYITTANAIIFLVDSYDRDRFPEARAELEKILTDERIKTIPILVLGNKIDLPGAASEAELRSALGLSLSTTGKGSAVAHGARPLEIFMCTITRGRGFREGIQWLSQHF